MKAFKNIRPRKKNNSGGKRVVKINKKLKEDFLVTLRDKLEDNHIKKYTFIVKGSKMYTAGVFWSEKNKKKCVFRSTYEFAYFYQLEADDKVLNYAIEPFEIKYFCPKTKTQKVYKPDALITYTNGDVKLIEIKPKTKVNSPDVKAKAVGARAYLLEHMPHVTYEFITEDQIFKSPKDYMKLLGRIDPEKYKKKMARIKNKPKEDKTELDYFKSKLPQKMKYAPCMLF